MSTSETLKAAAYNVGLGWCQHYFHKDGSFCLAGAIHEIRGTLAYDRTIVIEPLDIEEVRIVAEHLGLDISKGVHNAVARWNNAPERTQDEVIAALLGAAERAEVESGDLVSC